MDHFNAFQIALLVLGLDIFAVTLYLRKHRRLIDSY